MDRPADVTPVERTSLDRHAGAAACLLGAGLILGMPFLPFAAPVVVLLLEGSIPLGLVCAGLLWRGPDGILRGKARSGVALGWLLYALARLAYFASPFAAGPNRELGASLEFILTQLALFGLAERAAAFGRGAWAQAALGFVGAAAVAQQWLRNALLRSYPASLQFALAAAALLAVQASRLEPSTRAALVVASIPVAWGLDAFWDHGWPLRGLEAFAVLAYGWLAAALASRTPRPAPSGLGSPSPTAPPLPVDNR